MGWLEDLGLDAFLTPERLLVILKAALVLAGGLVLARVVAKALSRVVARRFSPQETLLVRRLAFWSVLSLVVVTVLNQLGVNLGVLLGAAGVLTVAMGFAAQTSASNFISGMFLIAERPFSVGDYIVVGDVVGEVLAIDLLSVKVRGFDNSLIRLPNETIIKERLTNLTHFPIRRVDVAVGVAYKEDVVRVRELLFEVADRNPSCLAEPRPQFFYDGFGDSALLLRFCVWTSRDTFYVVRNAIHLEIKEAFDAAGIEIPFPHRTLYTGSVTDPFPVRIVGGEPTTPQAAPEA